MSEIENPSAFPFPEIRDADGCGIREGSDGMMLRDWYAGQALPVAKDTMTGWELDRAFGPRSTGITREQIIAANAYRIADAMLAERQKGGDA